MCQGKGLSLLRAHLTILSPVLTMSQLAAPLKSAVDARLTGWGAQIFLQLGAIARKARTIPLPESRIELAEDLDYARHP